MSARPKAEVFEMSPSVPRILNAILLILSAAEKRNETVTQYDIVKTVFLADRAHLNKFGRPITYDNYVAMKFGPVPSLVYDILKENRWALNKAGITDLPWSRRDAPEISPNCFAYEGPQREPSEDVLSPTDMDELEKAFIVVKSLGFGQIKKLTHEDQAYIDAWEDEVEQQRFPMSYTLLFDVPNQDRAKELAFLSEHL
jgi:hypothetical protein